MMSIARQRCKMVIVVRTDLGMSKGKMCAQASHGALKVYKVALNGSSKQREILTQWECTGQAKVVVRAKSEQELRDLMKQARDKSLPTALITDAGHTQVEAGSVTVLAIGPGLETDVDSVCGHLKLL